METEKIMAHKNWNSALDNFKAGCIATGKERKRLLNLGFDSQMIISKDLKVPLYDVGCLIRAKS